MEIFALKDKHVQMRIPPKISLLNYFTREHKKEDGEVHAFSEAWKGCLGGFLWCKTSIVALRLESLLHHPVSVLSFLSWKGLCQIIWYHVHRCAKTLQILACEWSYPFRSGLGNIFGTSSGNRCDFPFKLNFSLERSELYLEITTQGGFAMGRLHPF